MRLVRMKVAQDVLDMSRQKLAQLITNGEIPGAKFGREWRIDLDALAESIAEKVRRGGGNVEKASEPVQTIR